MSIFELIHKHRYNAKNFKKYCKDANSTFVYVSVYLSYYDTLNELPLFVQNVYYITSFLADSLNSSLYLFFYDEDHYKYKNEIENALKEAKMDEALAIYKLAIQTFENVEIDRNVSIEKFKENVPLNVKYNVNFYEEELAKLQLNDYLYNQLNDYFMSELEKS